MAIKVDLEKAYDMLKWEFIRDTLRDAGFPTTLINLIMECISSTSVQILWNGEPTDVFSPSRGIHQGDPLPPYIFVLCVERLAHGIEMEVQTSKWKPIKLGRRGVPISHLFFADDLLLLAHASMDQVRAVKDV